MIFKPTRCRTRWEGLVVSFWILLIDYLLFVWVLQRSTDWLRFLMILLIALSAPILAHVLYRTWGAFTLEYWLDRNAVTIRWANLRQIVPVQAIRQIVQGGKDDADGLRWMHWPSPYVRSAYAPDLADVMIFATQPLSECLLLDTGEAIFAISPTDQAAFIDELQARFRMGAVQPLAIRREQSASVDRILGPGQIGPLLLGIGLLGVFILFGILMVRFPDLPNPLPIRYTADGFPEVVRDKEVLFRLPIIGFFAWLVNSTWGVWMARRNRPVGAYLLWGGTILIQVFLLLALRSVLP
ncbi:MAG: PH domain-containing protein [Caldilineaceae bacterium]